MAAIKSSFRVSNKADTDQWPLQSLVHQDDQLFEQFIDSDPPDFSRSENTADQSDLSLFFDVPGSPTSINDPSKPLSGVEAAPKSQAASVPHERYRGSHCQETNDDSPLLPNSSPLSSTQNEHGYSVVDAFALSLLSSRPASVASHHQREPQVEDHFEGQQQGRLRRTSSDCSVKSTTGLGLRGNADSASLPSRDKGERIGSVSPTMAQPVISRQPTQDAWAHRLEQRAESYNFAGNGTPMTPSTGHHRQSPVAKPSGGHGGNLYQTYNFNGVSTASNGNVTPYQRATHTPVTPSFNEFSMDSVITSPQVDRPPNWDETPISPFDFHYDPSSPPQQHHSQQQSQQHQSQMSSFDESRVQPWWPPTTSGAQGQRYHRQTSAPTMPQHSQSQYGTFYPTSTSQMSSSGLMINCQPGANEMSMPPSMPPHSASALYASSAPNSHNSAMSPYSRQSSMPMHTSSVRRTGSHPSNTPNHQSSVPSSNGGSRRTSKSSSSTSHRRSKSSVSPQRQGSNSKDNAQAGTVGFVNFTPSDSKRILTGVAPSGSSKTKARREKEAADRRRRLNEAAQRAVMEAGGDVSALERSGLFAS